MRACPAAQRDLPQSHRRLPLPMGRPHLCRRSIRHRNRAAARTFRSQRPPRRPCRPPYPRSAVIRGEQLRPVFDAMLEKATRLCEGTQGVLWTYDGERFHPAAMFGIPAEYADFLRKAERPGPATPIGRIARGELLVEIADLAADQSYQSGEPVPRAAVD